MTNARGEVRLTPNEWHLVEALVRNASRLVTQAALLREVWGPDDGTETDYLRVYMATSAASSNRTRRSHASSSPSPAWVTGSRPASRTTRRPDRSPGRGTAMASASAAVRGWFGNQLPGWYVRSHRRAVVVAIVVAVGGALVATAAARRSSRADHATQLRPRTTSPSTAMPGRSASIPTICGSPGSCTTADPARARPRTASSFPSARIRCPITGASSGPRGALRAAGVRSLRRSDPALESHVLLVRAGDHHRYGTRRRGESKRVRPGPTVRDRPARHGLEGELDSTRAGASRRRGVHLRPQGRESAQLPHRVGRAFVAASQQFQLFIGGRRVGSGPSYSYADHSYYETFDLESLLHPGKPNVIGVLHYWSGPGQGRPAGIPGLLVQIVVEHGNGTHEVIGTDGTWREHKANAAAPRRTTRVASPNASTGGCPRPNGPRRRSTTAPGSASPSSGRPARSRSPISSRNAPGSVTRSCTRCRSRSCPTARSSPTTAPSSRPARGSSSPTAWPAAGSACMSASCSTPTVMSPRRPEPRRPI